jgi:hypothetical protein
VCTQKVKKSKKYKKKKKQVAAKDGMWIDVIAKHAYRFIYAVRLQHIMAKNANQAHQLAA